LAKERKRVAEHRAKKKETLTNEDKQNLRKKEAERKRKYRQSKTENTSTDVSATPNTNFQSSYQRTQSFGKALARISRNLPVSPRKKKAVVHGLAKRAGIELQEQKEHNLSGTSRNYPKK